MLRYQPGHAVRLREESPARQPGSLSLGMNHDDPFAGHKAAGLDPQSSPLYEDA